MKSAIIYILFQMLFVSYGFTQKHVQYLRLLSANLSNSSSKSVASSNKRLSYNAVRRGHDIYTFSFQAMTDCIFKPESVWIKDKTTLPLSIVAEGKITEIALKKGESITVVAKHNGIFPYQKPPKRFQTEALISCEINGDRKTLEINAISKGVD